jgi:hypothetical protein
MHLDRIEKLVNESADKLFNQTDAVFLVVVRSPTTDNKIGTVQFTRRGEGAAFQLALRTLVNEIDLEIPVHEIYPDDDED